METAPMVDFPAVESASSRAICQRESCGRVPDAAGNRLLRAAAVPDDFLHRMLSGMKPGDVGFGKLVEPLDRQRGKV